jgi:peptidoglycan/xylan/chitin deacetylase (PgdA/CDA1 family)
MIYPGAVWSLPESGKTIYLTFDDGPVEGVTDKVLEILRRYNAKATFFCIGRNVVRYPRLLERILEEGHVVGNHTFTHPSAWTSGSENYLKDTAQAAKIIPGKLFRPPYGRLTPVVLTRLKKDYRVVMWDVLSRDYDAAVNPEQVYQNVTQHAREGSIIVFHDSQKAAHNVLPVLPRILDFFSERGYAFNSLQVLAES